MVNKKKKLGWNSIVYSDDWLLVVESPGCSKKNIDFSKNLLVLRSYCELKKKSNLTLLVTCQSVEFVLDSSIMTLELEKKKNFGFSSKVQGHKNLCNQRIRSVNWESHGCMSDC